MMDLTGQRFGRLVAVKALRRRYTTGAVMWKCVCDCGKYATIPSTSLRSLHSKSCGCWHREAARQQINVNRPKVSACLRHGGMSKFSDPGLARAYRCYRAALCRCYNPHAVNFRFYGGSGVTVCDEWRGPNGFLTFLRDMGKPPEGTQLGRFFDVGSYSKSHCAWMTGEQQQAERAKKRYFIKNSLDQALLIGPYSSAKQKRRRNK